MFIYKMAYQCKYGPRLVSGKCPKNQQTKKLRKCKYGDRLINGICPKKNKIKINSIKVKKMKSNIDYDISTYSNNKKTTNMTELPKEQIKKLMQIGMECDKKLHKLVLNIKPHLKGFRIKNTVEYKELKEIDENELSTIYHDSVFTSHINQVILTMAEQISHYNVDELENMDKQQLYIMQYKMKLLCSLYNYYWTTLRDIYNNKTTKEDTAVLFVNNVNSLIVDTINPYITHI